MKTSPRLRKLQRVVAYAAAHLDEDVSLSALARQAGLSRFHLHRMVSAATRETPKQLTMRLRLARAAVLLLTGGDFAGTRNPPAGCRTRVAGRERRPVRRSLSLQRDGLKKERNGLFDRH